MKEGERAYARKLRKRLEAQLAGASHILSYLVMETHHPIFLAPRASESATSSESAIIRNDSGISDTQNLHGRPEIEGMVYINVYWMHGELFSSSPHPPRYPTTS